MMKKVIIALGVVLTVWLVVLITNCFLAKFNVKPILMLKEKKYETSDIQAIEYIGLGYKVFNYQENKKNEYILKPFFKKIDLTKAKKETVKDDIYVGRYKGYITIEGKKVEMVLVLSKDFSGALWIYDSEPYSTVGVYTILDGTVTYTVGTPEKDSGNEYKFTKEDDTFILEYKNESVTLKRIQE